jgi:hypothetical protein
MELEPQPPPTLLFPRSPTPEKPPNIFDFPPQDFADDFFQPDFGEIPEDFLESPTKDMQAEWRRLKSEIIDGLRGPLQYRGPNTFEYWRGKEITGMNSSQFSTAVKTVLLALDAGYYPSRRGNIIGVDEWAALSSALLAAIGRGYSRPPGNEQNSEEFLDSIRKTALDHSENPSDLPFNNLFQRLTATAEQLHTYLLTDNDGVADWIKDLQDKTRVFIDQHAEEAIQDATEQWKTHQVRQRGEYMEEQIRCAVADSCKDRLTSAAATLALTLVDDAATTAEGSLPTPRRNPSRAAKKTHAPSLTGGRKAASAPPVPQKPSTNIAQAPNNTPAAPDKTVPPTPDLTSIIKAAMGPFMVRLEALERFSMPPPPGPPHSGTRDLRPSVTMEVPNRPTQPLDPTTNLANSRRPGEDSWVQATHQNKGKKKKGGQGSTNQNQLPGIHGALNLVPGSFSYATAAQKAVSIVQPTESPSPSHPKASTTEVTVLRFGGNLDLQLENTIRACPADAIAREVRTAIERAVNQPIRITAGRWSIGPRSKGNYVYTLAGEVPFDKIQAYERFLLAPFPGSTQLCPSLGWTRLLAHGVPFTENGETIFGPEALLKETRSLPGLNSTHFALPPRWVRPVERISSPYSSITFAFSDPDGSITAKLLKGRHGLFGKEVRLEKWLDKPPLVQCSRCHKLGHTAASRSCLVPKGDIKCARCAGHHATDDHARFCKGRHAVAGACDCKLPCLNCAGRGHDCRDAKCPARDNFRSRRRKPNPRKGKGKDNTASGLSEETAPTEPQAGPSSHAHDINSDATGTLAAADNTFPPSANQEPTATLAYV